MFSFIPYILNIVYFHNNVHKKMHSREPECIFIFNKKNGLGIT